VQAGAALASTATATRQPGTSSGLGSLEASRGGSNVSADCTGDGTLQVISGEIDVRCEPWDGAAWTASAWDVSAWMGDGWDATGWTEVQWDGRAWTGGRWSGRAWTGRAWTGSTWTESSWAGRAWTSADWTSAEWIDADWTTAEFGEFQTAFWGGRPPAWRKLPGEPADPDARTPAAPPRPVRP
jgi:serine protease AprX